MFKQGDYICYPMHGAGTVEGVEEREALGTVGIYYVLYFYSDKIKIMVPVSKAEDIGLRYVIDKADIKNVLSKLSLAPAEEDPNWNRRYRQNLDKLREGSALSVVEVLKSLYAREVSKGLSAGEKKMLSNARRFLIGELLLAGGGDEEELNAAIDLKLSEAIHNQSK